MRKQILFIFIMSLSAYASLALADIQHDDDVYIEGHLCVSDSNYCVDPETYPNNSYKLNADIKIKDDWPVLYFEDTSSSDNDWRIAIDSIVSESFSIFNGNDATDPGGDFIQSMVIEHSGPNNQLYLDNNGFIGFNTNTPSEDLEIASISPTIALNDTDGRIWEINGDAGSSTFDIRDVTAGTYPLVIRASTPSYTLYLEGTGDVGIGTDDPTVPLDVLSSDGTGQVQVTETNATNTARHLFRGKNNGPALFSLKDTSTARTWAFTVVPEGFTMSRQSSGVKEFLIYNNGDATLQGTLLELSDVNAKQDIAPVDAHNILAKISQLEISEWSYKDSPRDRHIGPMSQDFYKAFGLGGKKGVKGISTLDSSGVALAAIKALIEDNKSLRSESEALKSESESLKIQNEALNARLGVLEQQQAEMQAVMMRVLEQQAEPVLTSAILN